MKTIKLISKYVISLFGVTVWALASYGQQDPMYSQYMFNVQSYNPAYAGTWESIGLMALGRYQWVGFEGNPETQTFTAQAPLKNENIGLGLSVINDKIQFINRFALFTDYSYRLKLTEKVNLRLGLKAGFTNYDNNLGKHSLFTEEDPTFTGEVVRKFMPNFGLGAYLYAPRYYAGLSIPKILQNDFEMGTTNYNTNAEMRHFTLIGGYVVDLSESVKFRPSFITRYVTGSPLVGDLNASFLLKEKFWIGAMIRSSGAYGFNTQYIINDKLRVGYAVDFETSKLRSYSNGTHEIMVSYELNLVKTQYASPRYF
ncbi:PorP/SprF family type IX secretion system membrane protein [Gaoshiqia sp. Z1-71]|uniref:PorP/SprF family type IX secretion system membrane protein n=1 Tax=Gaoshiqia hydrogeniformans TaxID=3290090 RepID=UPI003BF8F8C5